MPLLDCCGDDLEIGYWKKSRKSLMKNHILILSRFIPWKKYLMDTEVYFVIFPSKRGGMTFKSSKFYIAIK